MNDLKELIKQFMPFAQEQMGFDRPPRLFLRQDDENAANPLGKTGFYDPQAESITIYVSGRHPKDILRSLAHELMHHTQKCNGDFDNAESEGMGEQGYAQNNAHMRTMEIQAYQASIVFRDWEDSLKETIYYEHLQKGANKAMSTKEWKNGELTTLLSEAFGFGFNLDNLNEAGGPSDPADYTGTRKEEEEETEKLKTGGALQEDSGEEEAWHDWKNEHADDDHIREMEHHLRALKEDRDHERKGAEYDHDKYEDEGYDRRDEAQLSEDSGEDEAWHDWKNEHADDDHIREMEHHLRALKDDRDYERHGAEYDHDKYEDEGDPGLEEGGLADRPENKPANKPGRGRRMDERQKEAVRALVRGALKQALNRKQ